MTTTEHFGTIWIESDGQRWSHAYVRRLSGVEAIGQLFSFDVEVVCDPEGDLPDGVRVGGEVTLVFERDEAEERRVHGVLATARSRIKATIVPTYELRIVPRAVRMALVETQEIFLGQSVPEIIRSKLERNGFNAVDFDLRLIGKYPSREFVAQYAESNLAFVSRLCEHVGISFFFEHHDGCDRMIFSDHPDGFDDGTPLVFSPRGEGTYVFALDRVNDLVPTSYIVQDYNYRTPLVDLTACFDLPSGNGGGIAEYGANVKTPDDASLIAQVRGEERRSLQSVVEGETGSMALVPGQRVTIADVPPAHVFGLAGAEAPPANASEAVLVVEVRHEAEIAVFNETAHPARYTSTFRAVPQGFTYRPPRRTPKPVIGGVVTGVIQLGPNGESGGVAQIDAEGRYWVELHFDTAQPGTQKASHPIRLSQPFAGPSYGMHFPLRRGTEVIVAFTNGDPDRPVIVGALYNTASPNPVTATNSGMSRIRTASGMRVTYHDYL